MREACDGRGNLTDGRRANVQLEGFYKQFGADLRNRYPEPLTEGGRKDHHQNGRSHRVSHQADQTDGAVWRRRLGLEHDAFTSSAQFTGINGLGDRRQQKHGDAQACQPRRPLCSSTAKVQWTPEGLMQKFRANRTLCG